MTQHVDLFERLGIRRNAVIAASNKIMHRLTMNHRLWLIEPQLRHRRSSHRNKKLQVAYRSPSADMDEDCDGRSQATNYGKYVQATVHLRSGEFVK